MSLCFQSDRSFAFKNPIGGWKESISGGIRLLNTPCNQLQLMHGVFCVEIMHSAHGGVFLYR